MEPRLQHLNDGYALDGLIMSIYTGKQRWVTSALRAHPSLSWGVKPEELCRSGRAVRAIIPAVTGWQSSPGALLNVLLFLIAA